jgi:putative transposase
MKRSYLKSASAGKENRSNGSQISVPWDREQAQILMQRELHGLATELGLLLAVGFLEEEVNQRCGPRYQRPPGRALTRYGHQRGVVTLAGQKLPLVKPRVRSTAGHGEVELATYTALQRDEAMPEAALRRLVRGVSCRDYEDVVERAAEGFGLGKSSVSRAFVRASAAEVERLSQRRFDGTPFLAVFIDGVDYAGETMIVALGVTEHGDKRILGLRQGATENTAVCTSLLEELRDRGLRTDEPMLFVLDGAKALSKAVKDVWGRQAVIQRCQQHKLRNVEAHVPEERWPEVKRRLDEAYRQTSYAQAKAQLQATIKLLERISPDAAASLREGWEETLTVVRLGVAEPLRRTLATTNPIESALSIAQTVTARVKRWRDGDMRQRWCAAGLLRAESKFRRVRGHRHLAELQRALKQVVEGKELDRNQEVAS